MARSGAIGTITLWIDGDCSFCSRLGCWVRRRAQHRGVELQVEHLPQGSEALRVECGGQRLEAAEALQCLLWHLGGWWRCVAWLLRCVPVGVRRWGYSWVARHRYWLFGRSVCPVHRHGALE